MTGWKSCHIGNVLATKKKSTDVWKKRREWVGRNSLVASCQLHVTVSVHRTKPRVVWSESNSTSIKLRIKRNMSMCNFFA